MRVYFLFEMFLGKPEVKTRGFAFESGFKPRTERKRPFQIEDIDYTNPKFSKQNCATDRF